MELYLNPKNSQHVQNIVMFERLRRRFEWIKFYQPNAEKAPWHVQCKIECATGEAIYLNFWPHKGKAQRDGCHTVEGEESIRLMIAEAIDDSTAIACERDAVLEAQSEELGLIEE